VLSIFLRNHGFPSLVLLTSLTLSACTTNLPQSVLRIDHHEEIVAETSSGPAYLHLVPHPDGLGWTVYPRQPIRQQVAISSTEHWHGWTQKHRSWNVLENGIAVPLCPITLAIGYASATLKPSDQAFELPFKTCSAILGYRWSENDIAYPVNDPSTPQVVHVNQPVTSGTLTLIVKHRDGTTRSVERQVTASTSPAGIPVRLRWVTQAAIGDGPSNNIWDTLSASLVLASEGQVLMSELLTVSPHQWQQAYASPILEADAAAWPPSLRIRWSLIPPEAEFPPDAYQFTKAGFEEGLVSHNLVVITQESRSASVNQLLAQHMDGRFDETRVARPGQWRGANVLLQGEIRTSNRGTPELWLTLINIETGVVLSKLNYEAPVEAWKDLVHAARGDVLDILYAHERH